MDAGRRRPPEPAPRGDRQGDRQAEASGTFEAKEYLHATMEFYRRFSAASTLGRPRCSGAFEEMREQPYNAMW